jgi:hypothetical protein
MGADISPPAVDRQAQFRRRLIVLVLLVLLILLLARFLTAAQPPPPPVSELTTATHTVSPTATFTPFPTDLFTPVVTFSAIPPTYLPHTSTATPTLTPTAAGSVTPTPMPPPSITVSAKACQGFGKVAGKVWIVAGCDTLARISQATGISLPRLLAANPDIHDPDLIYPGQIIRLPER